MNDDWLYILDDCEFCQGIGQMQNGTNCGECSGTGAKEIRMTDQEAVLNLMVTHSDWVVFAISNYARLWGVFRDLLSPVDEIMDNPDLLDCLEADFIDINRQDLFNQIHSAWVDAEAAYGTLMNDEPGRPYKLKE